MYCPECGYEYMPDGLKCPDCNVELVASLPPEHEEEIEFEFAEFVEILDTFNP